jgi:hypothetical protein
MEPISFREAIRPLYPELGPDAPDPDQYADSIIVRVLNGGSASLSERMIAYYGSDRVGDVARGRVDRLDGPAYRSWKQRLQLPDRNAGIEKLHRLWRG